MPYHHAISEWRQVVLIAILLLGLLFSTLDASIVSTSLVTISIDLQDFLDAPWVVLSYLLAYLGLVIGFAKLSDIYGRQNVICAAWILFAGFSIGCGLAKTMPQLVIFRALQGMGGSGMYSLCQIMLFEVGPRHKPSLMGALVGITLAISYILGPILGGTISATIAWRWIFWINVPFGILVIPLLYLTYPATLKRRSVGWNAMQRIDFLGNLLIISACTLLVFSLQEAGTYAYAWDSPVIVITLCVSSLSWVAFVVWEVFLGLRRSNIIEPILPLGLVRNRVYSACILCTFCTGFIYLSILVILPERFQINNGDNALYSGVHLLPMLGATSVGAFLAGPVSSKRNNTSWALMAAHASQLLGIGLMSLLSGITTENEAQYAYQVILGLGIGLSLGATTILASVQSRHADLAVAQGIVAQSRVLGGSIGIAICSIIFNNKVVTDLGSALDPSDLAALHRSPAISPWLPDAVQHLVKSVYASAFIDDIKMMAGVAAVGVVTSLFTYEKHPPPMPSNPQVKETLGIDGQSDMELDDFATAK